ncbi:hypothetical protein C0Q70_12673 [Pomacea canaliculata]|uniref:Uncharacterized protein n=1 Tax=Pomacea canaliculata TaxID=400727 RepID=A0A2T7P269_POMCA|nr:hypothetical protein C0Q70_12673 [Pomacea canaliculata]
MTFNPDKTSHTVQENANLTVTCAADCKPACDFRWTKQGAAVAQGAVLSLPAVQRDQAGDYRCLADNVVHAPSSRVVTLTVLYGPSDVTLFPDVTELFPARGSNVSVKCSATCNPSCTYTWYKGARVVPSTSGVLMLSSLSTQDSGQYECKAANSIDPSSSRFVNILVKAGPGTSIRFNPPEDSVIVVEGRQLVVDCIAECSPACTYVWKKGTRQVAQGPTLRFSAITREDAGGYSCFASNDADNQASKPLQVDVQSGPGSNLTFRPEGNRQVVREGGDLLVTCSADCSPPCSYRWKFGTEELTTAGGHLDLPVISRNQSGLYTCIAQNGNGNQGTRQLSVDVQYGPGSTISLFPSNTTQTLNEGASMSIKCSADCSPKCVYVWSRGSAVKQNVSSTDGVLTLVTVGPEDAGNYRSGPGNTVKIEPSLAVYEISEGTDLQMKCSATCSPRCTYTWYFDFERVKARDGILLKPNVSRADSGPYICYAANDVGIQGSNQIKVDVVYGPGDSIQLDPENALQIEAGNPFSLRCSADCRPPCSYVWSLGGQIKPSEGGKLNIGKASEADAGNYTCRASNKLGATSSKPLTVEVNYGPGSSIALHPAPDPALVISEGNDLTVTCSARCRPACSYSWYEGTKRVTSGDGVLFIPGFNRTHPRYYTCVADNGGSKATAVLQVEVNYGPGDKANLFPNSSTITAPVGESLSVQCSADCSPPCHYTWTRGGVHIQTDSLGVLLLRNLQPEARGAYVCSASNTIGKAATASVDIQLLCGWQKEKPSMLPVMATACRPVTSPGSDGPSGSVELFPPERSRELTQGETLSVKCSATCSPPCSVQWTKEDKVLSGKEGVLLLSNIQSDDSGVYTCTAGNGVGTDNAVNLTVHVNFGPENSVMFQPSDLFPSIVEGQTFQVRCSAHCLPACSYTWHYGGDGSSKVVSRDGLLTLPAVTRQDAGTYTCHADNGVGRRVTQDLQLAVRFPPNLPTFDPASTSYTIRERIDSVSDIRCYVDCNPRCNITWLKDGQSLNISGNVLALTTPDRQADGVYTCRATNDLGEREKNVTINVNYAPSITYFTINERRASSVALENDPVTLNCRVSSMPPSTIQIYNGSTLISAMTSTLQAKYSWQNAKCLDSGMYTCRADNGVGPLVSVMAELRVHCVPRLDPRVFKLPFVAANLGDTAVIHIPVIGEPTPSFQWYRVHGGVPGEPLAAKDQRGQSDKFFVSTPSSSTLTIQNVQVADYGDYLVTMGNTIGTSNYTFSVVPKSAPYRASHLTARPIDAHAVEVTWSPGFNGGARQQFSLEYLKDGTNGWRALALDPTIDDMTTSLSVNVSDLNPATAYTFRIRSRNTYGYSDYSNTARVVTDAAPDGLVAPGNVNTLPVLLGVGLAVGFLVGAGITAIVVVSRCRPRARKDESPIDDARSDTTYDTLYLRDALWAQHHIKLRSNTGSTRSRFDDIYDYKQPENKI